jgi:biopolymer transport protein ExbB/TolQ
MGTVLGMIGAFAKIAETSNPSPQELMHELSVALYCTALGLISSIPLMMLGTWLRLKIKKLEERTLGQLSDTIDDIKAEQAGNG